jgi:hypothetical protein
VPERELGLAPELVLELVPELELVPALVLVLVQHKRRSDS